MMNRPTVTSWDYIKDNFQADDRLAVVIKNSKEQPIGPAHRNGRTVGWVPISGMAQI